MTDKFYAWLTEADHRYRTARNTGQDIRKGQVYVNSLPGHIAKDIIGSKYDPFYRDDIIPMFLQRVEELMRN